MSAGAAYALAAAEKRIEELDAELELTASEALQSRGENRRLKAANEQLVTDNAALMRQLEEHRRAVEAVPAMLARVDAAFSHGEELAELEQLYDLYQWAAQLAGVQGVASFRREAADG